MYYINIYVTVRFIFMQMYFPEDIRARFINVNERSAFYPFSHVAKLYIFKV